MTFEVGLDHLNEVVFVRLLHGKVTFPLPLHTVFFGDSQCAQPMRRSGGGIPLFWGVELPQIYFFIFIF